MSKLKYNYKFRPSTYWPEESDPLEAILGGVRATRRRESIKRAWERGDVEKLPNYILQSELKEEQRIALGRLHPSLMGGEYLPPLQRGEVVIARVDFSSVMADVVEFVAKQQEDGTIRVRMQDEYKSKIQVGHEDELEYGLPLSFEEIVSLIEGAELGGVPVCFGFNYENYCSQVGDSSSIHTRLEVAESMRYFTTVSSDFYPDLEKLFQDRQDEWVDDAADLSDDEKVELAREDISRKIFEDYVEHLDPESEWLDVERLIDNILTDDVLHFLEGIKQASSAIAHTPDFVKMLDALTAIYTARQLALVIYEVGELNACNVEDNSILRNTAKNIISVLLTSKGNILHALEHIEGKQNTSGFKSDPSHILKGLELASGIDVKWL